MGGRFLAALNAEESHFSKFFFLISNKILLKRKKIHPGTQGVYKGEPNKSFFQINWNFPNLCAYFHLFLSIGLIMFSCGLQSWNCHIGDMGRRASVKRSQHSSCMLFLVFIFTSLNLVTSEFSSCANFV